MTLRAFAFPFPETRLLKAGGLIYKLKIRAGPSYRGVKVQREDGFDQEMEEIIRSVLGNLDRLQPFSSEHYNVFPYKKLWKVEQTKSNVYPLVLILYLDKKNPTGEPVQLKRQQVNQSSQSSQSSQYQPKRRRSDSPVEDAVIKRLLKDMEAEGTVTVINQKKRGNNEANLGGDMQQQEEEEENEEEEEEEEKEEEEEEEKEEEREKEERRTHEKPVRPGLLKRLASSIFPFSLFFRD